MRKMTGEEFNERVTFFDHMAQTEWLGSIHQQLKDIAGSWQGKNVLDVGCGTGRLLLKGKNEANKLSGIDLSVGMIKFARSLFETSTGKADSQFLVGDAYHLPFPERSFDYSFATLVIFLLPEPETALKELKRVTLPEGATVMLNPGPDMNEEKARAYAEKHGMEGFEKESLLTWANVSTRRHRWQEEDFSEILSSIGARHTQHTPVLDGLGLITRVEWKA